MTVSNISPARLPRRSAAALAILAFAQLIISLDINIVFVAIPQIERSLGFAHQDVQWVVSAYTVFCGGFLLLGGRASDILGRKRIFLFALAIYAFSSLLGGLATAPAIIIAARAIQGVGGAFLFPATLSLINTLFEEGPSRNKALAVWGGAGASGLTLGSIAGGVLTSAFGWPSVFYVNVGLALAALIGASKILPPDGPRAKGHTFDILGAILVTGGASLFVFTIVDLPIDGVTSTRVLVSFLGATVLLIGFFLAESKAEQPLMPLAMFANKNLRLGMAITFIYMASFGTLPYFLTRLLQVGEGYGALNAGLAFVLPSLAIAAGTQLGGKLCSRHTARGVLALGLITGVAGTILLAFEAAVTVHYAPLVPGLLISGLGQGITWTAMWILAASGVSKEKQGLASGMASTALNIGNAVGLAAISGIVEFSMPTFITGASALNASVAWAFVIATAVMIIGTALVLIAKSRASLDLVATGYDNMEDVR